eukprot:6205679-Pleurochrysis_carterae.AAC.1
MSQSTETSQQLLIEVLSIHTRRCAAATKVQTPSDCQASVPTCASGSRAGDHAQVMPKLNKKVLGAAVRLR